MVELWVLIAACVGAIIVGVCVGLLVRKSIGEAKIGSAEAEAKRILAESAKGIGNQGQTDGEEGTGSAEIIHVRHLPFCG